jgi:hypothetical protein
MSINFPLCGNHAEWRSFSCLCHFVIFSPIDNLFRVFYVRYQSCCLLPSLIIHIHRLLSCFLSIAFSISQLVCSTMLSLYKLGIGWTRMLSLCWMLVGLSQGTQGPGQRAGLGWSFTCNCTSSRLENTYCCYSFQWFVGNLNGREHGHGGCPIWPEQGIQGYTLASKMRRT